jgi:DNA (cytosine-5)-methyltransferase 1
VNVGSLFSGIGGFDLGFERAGMRVSWQVEQDPYCRAVLARHFPEAVRFEDVREVGAQNLCPVDLVCGGFPCQDLSPAGKGAGIDGARSGLWAEFARIICELRPSYVVVENVPALLTGKGKRWNRAPVGRVLGDLAEAGYDAEWACLSAREFGAPHLRRRVWIVAYPGWDTEAGAAAERGRLARLADSEGESRRSRFRPRTPEEEWGRRSCDGGGTRGVGVAATADADAAGCPEQRRSESAASPDPSIELGSWWAAEPDVGRVADGVPARVDRLAALGNALLPQIAEWIGRRVLLYEQEKKAGGVAR